MSQWLWVVLIVGCFLAGIAVLDRRDQSRQRCNAADLQKTHEAMQLRMEPALVVATLSFFVSIAAGVAVWYQGWVARDTERRQVRAYAYPTPIGIKDFELGKAPTGGITVRTMGQTPAYKVRGEINVGGLPYPLQPAEKLATKGTGQVQNSAFIGPHNGFTLDAHTTGVLNQPTVDAVNDGRGLRIYVWGRVDYEDVFAEPHWFTFCYAYDAAAIRQGQAVETCPRHNDDDHR